jgi:hypothetical protein
MKLLSLIPTLLFDLQQIKQQSPRSKLESSSKNVQEHHANAYNLV